MKRHITIPYTSGWFTVIIPTAEFLLLWIGLPVLLFTLLGWNFPDWVAYVTCGASLVIALAVCVLTYPLLMRLAERGRGELILEGDRLRWRTGRRWQEVDFSGPHKAEIAAGAGGLGGRNASVTLYPGGEMVHLAGIPRGEVLRLFPEPYFVEELAVRPKEGLWGFDLPADDPAARAFFQEHLDRYAGLLLRDAAGVCDRRGLPAAAGLETIYRQPGDPGSRLLPDGGLPTGWPHPSGPSLSLCARPGGGRCTAGTGL